MSQANEITARAKSNLAFTLIDLPREKRRNMAIFYAFCRTVDDIADEPGYTDEERHAALDRWQQVIEGSVKQPNELEQDVISMVRDLSLDTAPMLKIIEGCRADIRQVQPETHEDLLKYSYCVASCVGLASARIMGASDAAFPYAVSLGHALQMVNIIRDVAEDFFKHGRIYLPADDMARFGYTVEDIRNSVYSKALHSLLDYEAGLADALFKEAEREYATLSPQDKASLVPAQAMALIYKTILVKMKQDGFHIFAKRYRINLFHKLWLSFRAKLGTN